MARRPQQPSKPAGRADSPSARPGAAAHPTRNTLAPKARAGIADLLQAHLADSVDLQAAMKQAHWNVRGESFIALHKLFDDLAEHAEQWADLFAERLRHLGVEAQGGIRTAARSRLAPYPDGIFDEEDHLIAVSDRLAAFGDSVRKAIDDAARLGDAATADIFTEVSRAVDQDLWFVESHLIDE